MSDAPAARKTDPAWWTAAAGMVWLLAASCGWTLDNPVDPHRCADECPPGQWCYGGSCVPHDGPEPGADHGAPHDKRTKDGPHKGADKTAKQCTGNGQCADTFSCTTDSCDAGKCHNSLQGGWCLIGGACKAQGTRDPQNPYHACRPGISTSAYSEDVVVETFAGSGKYGTSDGKDRQTAQFWDPWGVAVHAPSSGKVTVYVTDNYKDLVRVISGNQVKTISNTGSTGFKNLKGIAVDQKSGKVYVADSEAHSIWLIQGTVVSRFAGSGAGYTSQPTARSKALFKAPKGVAVDSAGRVYVADTGNHRVRRIAGGQVSTIAGSGFPGGNIDGRDALKADLAGPDGIHVNAAGDTIHITDRNRVARIKGGKVTLLAGDSSSGKVNGPALSARFYTLEGVGVGRDGALLLMDRQNHCLRMLHGGQVSLLAGGMRQQGNQPVSPPPATSALTKARFDDPAGLAVDPNNGEIYIADQENYKIRRVRLR